MKEAYVYDPTNNENHLSFTSMVINKGIPDSQFLFTVPAGVTVGNPPTSAPTE